MANSVSHADLGDRPLPPAADVAPAGRLQRLLDVAGRTRSPLGDDREHLVEEARDARGGSRPSRSRPSGVLRAAPPQQRLDLDRDQRGHVRPRLDQQPVAARAGQAAPSSTRSGRRRAGEDRQQVRAGQHVHRVDLQQPDGVDQPAQVAAVDRPGRFRSGAPVRAAARRSPSAGPAQRSARGSRRVGSRSQSSSIVARPHRQPAVGHVPPAKLSGTWRSDWTATGRLGANLEVALVAEHRARGRCRATPAAIAALQLAVWRQAFAQLLPTEVLTDRSGGARGPLGRPGSAPAARCCWRSRAPSRSGSQRVSRRACDDGEPAGEPVGEIEVLLCGAALGPARTRRPTVGRCGHGAAQAGGAGVGTWWIPEIGYRRAHASWPRRGLVGRRRCGGSSTPGRSRSSRSVLRRASTWSRSEPDPVRVHRPSRSGAGLSRLRRTAGRRATARWRAASADAGPLPVAGQVVGVAPAGTSPASRSGSASTWPGTVSK